MSQFAAARTALDSMTIDEIAVAIETIGFSCTDCGACCRSNGEDHVATVFPGEIRDIQRASGREWKKVARPMPFGLTETDTGETFEWALQSTSCGDCTFYDADATGGGCTIYADRPFICQTYPFQLALPGVTEQSSSVTTTEGPVRAFECEGLGRAISPSEARSLAKTLKARAKRELREAESLLESYAVAEGDHDVIVHDSEGPKRPDGSSLNHDS